MTKCKILKVFLISSDTKNLPPKLDIPIFPVTSDPLGRILRAELNFSLSCDLSGGTS